MVLRSSMSLGVTKRISIIALLAVLAFASLGCSGQQSNTSSSSNATSDTETSGNIEYRFNLNKDVSFDGVTVKIDSSWNKSGVPHDYEIKYSIKPSGSNYTVSEIEIRGYLNGETASIDTFKTAWKYQTDYSILEEWEMNGNKYTIFAGDSKIGNWASYLMGYSPDNKGFSVFFSLGLYGAQEFITDNNKNEIISFFKQVTWDPSQTTVDSLDLYKANQAAIASSSSNGSSSSSSLTVTPNAPTVAQQNALKKAQQYLDYTAFSYTGLIEQLEYEQFSHEDAVYAADNCGADWNAQAARKAKQYMDYSSFSRGSLIDQLKYEGFTPEQAAYGASSVGL